MIPLNIIQSSNLILKEKNKLQLYTKNNFYEFDIYSLTNSDMGYLYEKYVGLFYENMGYKVIYRGLINRVLDKGIDLIISNSDERLFLQCKLGKLSTQKVEKIKYYSSRFLIEEYDKTNAHLDKKKIGEKPKKINFSIVIPNKRKCLGRPENCWFFQEKRNL